MILGHFHSFEIQLVKVEQYVYVFSHRKVEKGDFDKSGKKSHTREGKVLEQKQK